MTSIGNLLLIVASLIYVALLSSLLDKTQSIQGEYAVGYVWGIMILYGGFLICISIIAVIIGYQGGFQWMFGSPSTRFFTITIGLLCAMITTALSGLFKYEHGPVPVLLKIFSSFVPVAVPLLLLISAAFLLNENISIRISSLLYKIPLILIFIIGISGTVSAALGLIKENKKNEAAQVQEAIDFQKQNHDDTLKQIDSCDVMKDMVFILVFTDANQDKDVREKAVAKVRTNPHWQQELVNWLKNDWAPEVFTFLASNPVDDISLFPEAVKTGVLIQAKLFRESIRRSSHPSHFYKAQFLWETERVLRTVDKFIDSGVDYRDAVKELRAALEETSDFEKPAFECAALMDDWIKKHP